MEVIMIFLFLLCSSFCSFAQTFDSKHSAEPLDFILHDHALKSQLFQRSRHETGTLYEVKLPASLSGMNVSYVRLRSKTLWRKGANFSSFKIPSRTLPMPYAKRVVIMYQDLGNLSYQLYNHTVSRYSLVSSVVGFRVYDASNPTIGNVRKLDFNTSDAPISVHFPKLKFPRGAKCASFRVSNGKVYVGEMSVGNVCYTRSYGWFAVVIPKRRKERVWVWCGVGFVTVVLVSFVGMVLVKMIKVKRLDEMEMQMEEGSVDLETVWIGYSKMPCATVTRTHPNLENAGLAT
ncbi:hypothetical protein L6452_16311 [Arctium lappa]|uniref:Uncharacterized protein n=1 Tax=Arctium lappa TaxID=4217 RepID=A0ACB9C0C0_ARCLA|nr:hypothetical protein L6452_16311 [Arctium lappa]